MRSTAKSKILPAIDVKDFYSMSPGLLWRGFKQESIAFWALCFYLAYEYTRPDLIYPSIAFIPWGKLAILTAFFAMFMDKSVHRVKSAATIPFLLFFLIVYLSCLTAFMPEESWRFISIPVNWVLLYFLIINLVNTEKRFILFLLVFFIVNFKMSQFGLRTFIARGFSFTFWGISGSPGWFENGGDVALQMTIFIPIALVFVYALREHWSKGKRYLIYLLPFTGLISLVAASSRGALLAFACICVWYLVKSRLGLKAILGAMVLGVLLYSVMPDEMIDKFRKSGEDVTSQSRMALWTEGIDAAKEHPLLGVGFENWFEYCWRTNPTGLTRGQWCLDLHNTYVEAAAETGFFGLSIYILLNLMVLGIGLRTRRNARAVDNRFIFYMSHGFDAALIGYMVSSIFVSVLFYPMFWVHLAMVVALNTVSKKQVAAMEGEGTTSGPPARGRQRSRKMGYARSKTK